MLVNVALAIPTGLQKKQKNVFVQIPLSGSNELPCIPATTSGIFDKLQGIENTVFRIQYPEHTCLILTYCYITRKPSAKNYTLREITSSYSDCLFFIIMLLCHRSLICELQGKTTSVIVFRCLFIGGKFIDVMT